MASTALLRDAPIVAQVMDSADLMVMACGSAVVTMVGMDLIAAYYWNKTVTMGGTTTKVIYI